MKKRVFIISVIIFSFTVLPFVFHCTNPVVSYTTTTTTTIETPAFTMITVTGGKFTLGWDTIAEPTHDVILSNFSIGETEVCYELWYDVKEWAVANGYTFTNEGVMGNDGTGNYQHPVTKISFYDAVKWCNALSEMKSLTPAYYTTDVHTQIYKTDDIDLPIAYVYWAANGYRLLTEAEWEYAARCKGIKPGNEWSGDNTADTVSWYIDNSSGKTHPVKTKIVSEAGTYDMSGNVCEWIWDWYADYEITPVTDPRGGLSGIDRVIRGGGYNSSDVSCRVSIRDSVGPDSTSDDLGFRFCSSVP